MAHQVPEDHLVRGDGGTRIVDASRREPTGRTGWESLTPTRRAGMSAGSVWVDVGTVLVLLFIGVLVRHHVSGPALATWLAGSVLLAALGGVISRTSNWQDLRPGHLTRAEWRLAAVTGALGLWILWFYRTMAPVDDAVIFGIVLVALSVWWMGTTAALAATPLSFLVVSMCLALGPFLAVYGRTSPFRSHIWMVALLTLAIVGTYLERRVAYVRSVDAEDEVRARGAEIELAFDAILDGLLVTQGTTAVRANPAVGHLLRRSDDEVVGRDLDELLGPDAIGLTLGVVHRVAVDRLDGSTHVLEVVGRATAAVDPSAASDIVVWVCRDVSELVERENLLKTLIDHDDLTGLANRRALLDRIDRAIARTEVAVLAIDVDDFKTINDQYGHAIGDLVLQSVSRRLRARIGSLGIVARPGGDEFVVLLTDPTGVAERESLAAALVAEARVPLVLGGVRLRATLSIGVATGPAGGSAQTMLHDADLAMYRAKRAGRSTWRAAEPFPFDHWDDDANRAEGDADEASDRRPASRPTRPR